VGRHRRHDGPVDVADLWDVPASVLARLGSKAETDLLLGLRRGARAWAPLARTLAAAAPAALNGSVPMTQGQQAARVVEVLEVVYGVEGQSRQLVREAPVLEDEVGVQPLLRLSIEGHVPRGELPWRCHHDLHRLRPP